MKDNQILEIKDFEKINSIKSDSNIGYYGKFFIFKKDNEFFCSCPKFLKEAQCKHLRKLNLHKDVFKFEELSSEEKVIFDYLNKEFNIKAGPTKLIRQFQIARFSELQNIKPRALINLILNSKYDFKLYPLRQFGIEFEGTSPISASELEDLMNNRGLPASDVGGYSHQIMNKWRISRDPSVSSVSGGYALEIASPKLLGLSDGGSKEVKKLLDLWNDLLNRSYSDGVGVNRSCGLHVHISVYDLTNIELFRNMLNFYLFQEFLYSIVPRHRKENSFCSKYSSQTVANAFVKKYYPITDGRYFGLNVSNIDSRQAVEFRLFNGSTVYEKVFTFVTLANLFIERSRNWTIKDIYEIDSCSDYAEKFSLFLEKLGLYGHKDLNLAKKVYIDRLRRYAEKIPLLRDKLVKVIINIAQSLDNSSRNIFSLREEKMIGELVNNRSAALILNDVNKIFRLKLNRLNSFKENFISKIVLNLVSISKNPKEIKAASLDNSEVYTVKISDKGNIKCNCQYESNCVHRSYAIFSLALCRAFVDLKSNTAKEEIKLFADLLSQSIGYKNSKDLLDSIYNNAEKSKKLKFKRKELSVNIRKKKRNLR